MKIEKILKDRFSYSFPDLNSPFAAALQETTDHQWIDGELKDLISFPTTEKYKRTKTAICLHIVGLKRKVLNYVVWDNLCS